MAASAPAEAASCKDTVGKPSKVKGATGTVTWFDMGKGFGFITPDGGGPDLFVHFRGLDMGGFKFLPEGHKVEFEVAEGQKGLQARNVRVI